MFEQVLFRACTAVLLKCMKSSLLRGKRKRDLRYRKKVELDFLTFFFLNLSTTVDLDQNDVINTNSLLLHSAAPFSDIIGSLD